MGIGVKFSNMGSKIDVKIKDEDSCAKVDSNSAVYIRGEDGDNGATFYPEMSEDGTLSWTNDKELENPESVNIKGPPGDQGIQGIQGPAGKDGYTPVKGKDYFTKEEVADIARAASDLVEVPETAKDAVLYVEQELTDEQRAQARANIDKYQWHTLTIAQEKKPYILTATDSYLNNAIDWDVAKSVMSPTSWGQSKNATAMEDLIECVRTLYGPTYAYEDAIMNINALVEAGAFLGAWREGLMFVRNYYGAIIKYFHYDINSNTLSVYGPESLELFIYKPNVETGGVKVQQFYTYDTTLTLSRNYADAKAVGDALKLKVDKSDIATDDEILEMLAELDMLPVVADQDGALLSDENENILLW